MSQTEALVPTLHRATPLPKIHTSEYIHREVFVETLSSRVFMNGNSQAVRIPAEFRLNVSRVEISRNEVGDLIIHPIAQDRGGALLQALQAFDGDFIEALEDDRRNPLPPQEREPL